MSGWKQTRTISECICCNSMRLILFTNMEIVMITSPVTRSSENLRQYSSGTPTSNVDHQSTSLGTIESETSPKPTVRTYDSLEMVSPSRDSASLIQHVNPENTEIERKWKVDISQVNTIPGLLRDKGKPISQGYIAITDDVEVRLRQKGSAYFQTVKSDGDLVRQEFEIKLPKAEFDVLWPSTLGKRLEKVRFEIPHKDHTIELDIYDGKLKGLAIAEVEFESISASAAFTPPPWIGEEVTANKSYKNKNLALMASLPES